MKSRERSVKKLIKRTIEIRQGVKPDTKKMNKRDKLRRGGTPPKGLPVGLVSRNEIRSGVRGGVRLIVPKPLTDSIECIINFNTGRKYTFESVKQMIMLNYGNLVEYKNTLVVLGYNITFNISHIRKEYPDRKVVIYQLEQLFDNKSNWYNSKTDNPKLVEITRHIRRALEECDEIWDYDIDNIDFMKSEGITNKIKHVPLEYTSELIRKNKIKNPKYDLLFFGTINDKRAKYLSKLFKKYNTCIIAPNHNIHQQYDFGKHVITAMYSDEIYNYIFNSKIIINLHYYDSSLQEQVRLFDLLINNRTIVSEKSRKNYFGDLIYEFDNDKEMYEKIDFILDNKIWENSTISEDFKNYSLVNYE